MPTPPSICSGPSTCFRTIFSGGRPKFDQAVAGSQRTGRRNHRRRQESRQALSGDVEPRLFARPSASRRAGPAGEARGACRSDRQKRRSAPRRLDQMETWAAAFMLLGNQFKRLGLKGDAGRRERAAQQLSQRQDKPIGELETNLRAAELFRQAPRKRAARPARRRDRRIAGEQERQFQRHAERLVARRRRRDRPQLRQDMSARPSSSRR